MSDARGLRLRVLGEVGAARDGTDVPLGGRRQRAVLAVLVLGRGEVVPADRLADCLWGDDPPAHPVGVLQSYVSHLRRRLEPDAGARSRRGVILSAGLGYALRVAPDAVDSWRFERAVQAASDLTPPEAARLLDDALRLWRGPAFAEYADEPWTQAEITRLTGLRAVARERLLGARLALGEAALLVPELEGLVEEDPLREESWRLLVLALYRAQRQGDALAALRRARETLADALGVDPGPELRALERDVLAQSPALDVRRPVVAAPSAAAGTGPSAAPPAATRTAAGAAAMTAAPLAHAAQGGAGTSPPRPAPSAAPPDLPDRDREVATLSRAVADVRDGVPGVVLIEGPAGIGKTRLLTEAVRVAREGGVPVLSARGTPLESSFAFGAVRQLFEPCVVDDARGATVLRGAAAGARAVFQGAGGDETADRAFAVLHGLYWLTVNLTSDGPLVLTVDDVQYCDSGSLRFLAYLTKRLEGLPVLLVVTVRTGEQHPDHALLAELVLDSSATVLRPRPLSAEATGTLVAERLGEAAEAFVGACHRMTSGNPLLLRQLLRALEAEGVRPDVSHTDTVRAVGSRAVSSLVMLRLRRMPPILTTVARAVAVLGRGAELPTVAALAREPEERTAAALDALRRGEVLKPDGTPTFVHPLVRDAVYEDLPASERALHHERAARVLQEHGAAPEQVAAHLLLAPHRGSAATVATLRAAARAAVTRGTSDGAVVLLRRALEEPVVGPERADVLLDLGMVETLVDGPAAVGHLTEAYALLDDRHRRAEVAAVIARTHVFASEPGVATAFARDAVAHLPEGLDDARQALVALQRITGYMHALPPATYRSGPEPGIDGAGPGARMLAATLAFERLVAGEDRAGAVELARFALDGEHLLAVDNGLLWVVAADVLLVADADVGDFWDRAGRRAHASGSLFAALSVNLWRGFAQWRHGALDEALQSFADATEQHRMWGGSAVGLSYAAAFTAGVHLDRGDGAAARAVLDDARALPPVGEGSRLLAEARARALVEDGRPADALAELDAAVDPLGIVNPVWAPWRSLRARALAGLGRVDEAIDLVDEEVRLLRRWGAATGLGPSLRLLGELRGASGTPQLREAVDLLAPTRAVLELARARLSLGRSADVADAEAADLLRRAAEAARACGARGVLRDAAAALAARGHPVDGLLDPTGLLTARERQVLELTRSGLEVNEVAQRLLLTPGTVRGVLERAAAHAGG